MNGNALPSATRELALAAIWTNAWTIKATLVRTVAGAGAGGNTVYDRTSAPASFMAGIPNNAYCRALGAGQGVGQVLLNVRTDGNGGALASDVTLPAVAAGDDVQLLVIYRDTGSEATDRILVEIDTAVLLPFTPDGLVVPVAFAVPLFVV